MMKTKGVFLIMLLCAFAFTAMSQTRTITGSVTSGEDNGPLPGATISEKGGNTGVTTDADGKYSITVDQSATTLVFKFVGFKTMEKEIGSGDKVDATLEVDALKLDEVVVTALGVSKEKKSLGYAVSEISAEEISNTSEQNVIQSLAAKAPGIQVVGSGGTPGASSKILIRGNSTFTGANQPLIIVDGVPINNETNNTIGGDYPFNAGLSGVPNSNRAIDLNPDDIESVTVLKGAAAAALYGVRAGNGAIVYTTKRGKGQRGKGVKVTFSSRVTLDQVNKLPELQDTYAQGVGGGAYDTISGVTETFIEGNPGPDGTWFTGDDVSLGTSANWGPKLSEIGEHKDYPGYYTDVDSLMSGGKGVDPVDNVGDFFKTGVTWQNNLAVVGGNQASTFRLSVGNTRQTGIVPNTDFNRTSVRITTDTKMNDKVSVGATINYINSGGTKAQNGSNLSGVMLGLTRTPPQFSLAGDGEDGYKFANGNQRQYFFPYDNPYWTAYENPFTDEINRVLGNVNVRYTPMKWLNLSYRLGTDFYDDNRKQIFAIGSWDPPNPTGQIEDNSQRVREIYQDILATVTRSLTDKLDARVTVGNNIYQYRYQDLYARGRDLSVPGNFNLSNAADLYSSERTEIYRTYAFFYDGNLDWDRWLYFNFTGRYENSSTYGVNSPKFNFYPSFSASAIFSNFVPENDIFSYGKIRASFAQVGINPAPYTAATYFVNPFFTDGFTDGLSLPYLGVNGFGYSDIIGDNALAPELINEFEVGTDLRFWNGRLNLDITYYNKKSSQLLVDRPIAPSTGFGVQRSNFGEMVNKGWEILATGSPIETKDFKWNISVNFTKNTNEVLLLDPEGLVDEIDIETAFSSIHSYAVVGQAYGQLFGTVWERNDNGDLIINPNTGLPIVALQEQALGNPFPDWTMGIRNNFTYKGVTLSALLDIRQGGSVWCGTCARLNRLGRTAETTDRDDGNKTIEGVLAEVDATTGQLVYTDPDDEGNQEVVATSTANNVEVSAFDYWTKFKGDQGAAVEEAIHDGSWVRLRELSISYRLKIKDNKHLQYIDLTASGRNLWLSTKYPGVDPETSLLGAGSNINGFDYFNMPGTRSYTFGVKFGF
jgi:TonB-linked SusC/RagA family outer membrane protein